MSNIPQYAAEENDFLRPWAGNIFMSLLGYLVYN